MNKGKIVQVMGPVIDVKFDVMLPEINHALTVHVEPKDNNGEGIHLTLHFWLR